MKSKPLVTIIVPAYNAGSYIRDCLSSITTQTYEKIEVIIINDGSTDFTQEICESYVENDKRIHLYNRKNHGVSCARNFGIEHATGEYLTFVDADDALKSDAIENMINLIEREAVDVVRMHYSVSGLTGIESVVLRLETGRYVNNHKNKLVDAISLGLAPAYVWLLCIRRSSIENLRFDEDVSMMEDTLFYISLIKKIETIFISDCVTYLYEDNRNSISRSKTRIDAITNDILKVNKKITKLCSQAIIPKLNAVHASNIANYVVDQFIANDRRTFKAQYDKLSRNEEYVKLVLIADMSTIPKRFAWTTTAIVNRKYTQLLFMCYFRQLLNNGKSLLK